MEVIYLFCETAHIRIPFFCYDRGLFLRLVAKGGIWDKTRQEFVFERSMSAGQFSSMLSGIPFVAVDSSALVPVRIFGFLGRAPKEAGPMLSSMSPVAIPIPSPVSAPPVLPDKFPEHWRVKLETELRARKYSPQTRRSYIYFNSLLCNTLKKNPEEIIPEDITQFLATVEKGREYSAASLNLALSSIKFFYRVILNCSITEQRRPRHDRRLPVVLSKDEISKIIGSEKNPKHRLLLMLAYSSGLRVSEVLSLKKGDIDIARRLYLYVPPSISAKML